MAPAHQVVIKSYRGHFLEYGNSEYPRDGQMANEWQMYTPVKNGDGSWSFKGRENKWLSAHGYYDTQRYYVNFMPENNKCEHWWLEPYAPQATRE